MPKWLRKSFVVMVTILTFGMITPSQAFLFDHANGDRSSKRETIESETTDNHVVEKEFHDTQSSILDRESFIQNMVKEAEDQAYIKFGPRIKPVIEDEFKEVILPKIERAIETVAFQFNEGNLSNLAITEFPSGGNSEKIFHIIDRTKKQDIIRFHVRKDHPPQEGYYFNFHYHTYHDQFQTHHDLGVIYWDKNTPPKWMS